jgi:hypothetical protein
VKALVAAAVIAAAATVHAAPTRFAIVIGVDAAETEDVPRLRYADDDAVAMHLLFTEAGVHSSLYATLDEDTQRRNPTVHPAGRATWAELEAAFAALERSLQDGDELYIFFSGHGDVSHGEGYVVLEDGRLTRHRLRELLERTKLARQHVIIDACRSYYLAFDKRAGKRTHLDRSIVEPEPGLPDHVGFVLSTSSDRDSHEWDRFGGGVFSHEVRSGLRGAADANGDGVVTYAELGAFLTVANQSIPNERFRPDFLVRPPGSALSAPLLAWGSAGRAIVADAPHDHFYVEDATGTRLLDAHPGPDQHLVVRLPAAAPLFVRPDSDDDDSEIVLGPEATKISDGERQPASIERKGALHLAFEQLFATPFGEHSVAEFERAWSLPAAEVDTPEPRSSSWNTRRIAGWTFLGSASLGLAIQGIALERYVTGLHASQAERHARNGQIDDLDLAAYALYGVAGFAGVTWLGATLWQNGGAVTVSGRF